MDLFEHRRLERTAAEAPLAARMRPRTLDEFIGQGAIVGEGRLLRRAIQADQLSSLIFYGPPGTGKTTLAQIIANTTQAHFIAINAVLAGIKDIREAIAGAQEIRRLYNQRTILFVDEVHRFNKAQQDALLPWVENGTVILIGATTENPYFEVNKALVSRSRLFQLKPLQEEDLRQVIQHALSDPERGYGDRRVNLDADAESHLVNVANGDARALLNALELAIETTSPDDLDTLHITLKVAEESIQQRAVLYDKEGDAHFDIISALIKSVRGSDPDAALYWLARMVYAGEDPRFILRRLLILASEDVGLADPQAVGVVNACAQAFDRVGMPEGRYPLAQATLYLANAPKSNSVMGFFDALATVEREREADVPSPLKDANRDREGFGHGANYLYPHAYRDHWVAQQYLPTQLQGQVFYQPSDQGAEVAIQRQVAQRREAQLAALFEGSQDLPDVLSFGQVDAAQERWLQRTLSQTGERLSSVRDRIFDLAHLQRHHVVLDLQAGTGLLTWEAVRQVPEGGVYTCVASEQEANALQEQAQALPDLARPIMLLCPLVELASYLSQHHPQLRFDCLMGRNALLGESDKAAILRSLLPWLQPGGRIILAESVMQRTQRVYQFLEPSELGQNLYRKLIAAEEMIYQDQADRRMNWSEVDLEQIFQSLNLRVIVQVDKNANQLLLSSQVLQRWFTRSAGNEPSSYADYLARQLSDTEIQTVHRALLKRQNQTVLWRGEVAIVEGMKPRS